MSNRFNKLLKEYLDQYDSVVFEKKENLISRNIRTHDRVKFTKNALQHDFFKNKAAGLIELIKNCMDPKFGYNLKVGATKNTHPTYQAAEIDVPADQYVDVYIEYAPQSCQWTNPITVPLDVIELQDDGINHSPIADNIKYKSKDNGTPQEINHQSSAKFDTNLINKNKSIQGGTKWDDTKPGSGNQPKKDYGSK